MASPLISVRIDGVARLEKLLKMLEVEVREKALRAALKAGATVLAREARAQCPVGDLAHNPGKKPLKETIGTVMRGHGDRIYAVVGPMYPAGAHGHLVEYGHEEALWGVRTGRRVPPHPFMRPAYDAKKREIQAAIAKSLIRAVRRAREAA